MRRAIVVLSLSLAATAGMAQTRTTCPEANFSVAVPAGWTWSAAPSSFTWSAVSPRGDRFTIHSPSATTQKVDDVWLRELLPGIARDAGAHRQRIEHLMHARATAPLFPSVRYAYTRVGSDGHRTFVDGYVATAGRLYAIEYASVSRELLPEFWSFVRSFQVADKFTSQRTARASQASVIPGSALPVATDVLGRPLAPNQGGGPRANR